MANSASRRCCGGRSSKPGELAKELIDPDKPWPREETDEVEGLDPCEGVVLVEADPKSRRVEEKRRDGRRFFEEYYT